MNTPSHQSDQQHQEPIDERTITPSDIWIGRGSSLQSELTPIGVQLSKTNPELCAIRVGQAKYDLAKLYPTLYDRVTTPRPEEPTARRPTPAAKATASVSIPKPPLPDAELPGLFGPNSNAGRANQLAKNNLLLYRRSKDRAIELGLISPSRGRK